MILSNPGTFDDDILKFRGASTTPLSLSRCCFPGHWRLSFFSRACDQYSYLCCQFSASPPIYVTNKTCRYSSQCFEFQQAILFSSLMWNFAQLIEARQEHSDFVE